MTVAAAPIHVLHLGCGRKGHQSPFVDNPNHTITSLDADPLLEPDVVCVLGRDRIPLEDDSVDVAVAIHVLEHIGKPGETTEWFQFWEELYRVLKPGGQLHFESPLYSSVWCWADPSHVRALSPQTLIFFEQSNYRIPGSAISPYRIRCDFALGQFVGVKDGNPEVAEGEPVSHFRGTLTALKPLKVWWEDAV